MENHADPDQMALSEDISGFSRIRVDTFIIVSQV